MNDIMRDRTEESLGMRVHEVNKHRAVERAVERLRYGLGPDWRCLTIDDIASLYWLLGELWAITSREEWEGLHFSKLDLCAARAMVVHGERLRRHGVVRSSTSGMVTELLADSMERAQAAEIARLEDRFASPN